MVFAVVEHPFFAEVVADLEHFAVGRGDLVKVVLKTETACIPHTPYVRIKDFVRTTAC